MGEFRGWCQPLRLRSCSPLGVSGRTQWCPLHAASCFAPMFLVKSFLPPTPPTQAAGRILLSTSFSHLRENQKPNPDLFPRQLAGKAKSAPKSLLLWRWAGPPGSGAQRPGGVLEAAGARGAVSTKGALIGKELPKVSLTALLFRTVTALLESYSTKKGGFGRERTGSK